MKREGNPTPRLEGLGFHNTDPRKVAISALSESWTHWNLGRTLEMGAGGSVDAASLPATLSRDQAKDRAGDRWGPEHEELFREDGTVTKEQFLRCASEKLADLTPQTQQGQDRLQNLISVEPNLAPPLNWEAQIMCHAPAHILGLFLDPYNFAALATSSSRIQESLRNVIRARNDLLPEAKQMANLGETFCVSKIARELRRWEIPYLVENFSVLKEWCAKIMDKMPRGYWTFLGACHKLPTGILDVFNAVAVCLGKTEEPKEWLSFFRRNEWIYNDSIIELMRNFDMESWSIWEIEKLTKRLKPFVELEHFMPELMYVKDHSIGVCCEWVLAVYLYASVLSS